MKEKFPKNTMNDLYVKTKPAVLGNDDAVMPAAIDQDVAEGDPAQEPENTKPETSKVSNVEVGTFPPPTFPKGSAADLVDTASSSCITSAPLDTNTKLKRKQPPETAPESSPVPSKRRTFMNIGISRPMPTPFVPSSSGTQS